MYNVVVGVRKVLKWDKKLESQATKKGAKKLAIVEYQGDSCILEKLCFHGIPRKRSGSWLILTVGISWVLLE
jgi:hypothetical protein